MAEPPDQEEIEARLCAYIDGELGAAERLEIERHLQANPGHMALIADLVGQRAMLRQLPRETAPPDVTDVLQAQLEREALLTEGEAGELETTLRIDRFNPWPALLSVAAVLALAIGLGIVVYSVLPPKHPAVTIADIKQANPQAASPTESPASNADQAPGMLAATEPPRDSSASPMMSAVVDDAGAFFAAAPENPTLLVTIRADDLRRASDQATRFLADNGLAWSAAGEAVLDSLETGRPLPVGGNLLVVREALNNELMVPQLEQHALNSPQLQISTDQLNTQATRSNDAISPVAVSPPSQPQQQTSTQLPQSQGVRRGVILVRNLNGRQLAELAGALAAPDANLARQTAQLDAGAQVAQVQPAQIARMRPTQARGGYAGGPGAQEQPSAMSGSDTQAKMAAPAQAMAMRRAEAPRDQDTGSQMTRAASVGAVPVSPTTRPAELAAAPAAAPRAAGQVQSPAPQHQLQTDLSHLVPAQASNRQLLDRSDAPWRADDRISAEPESYNIVLVVEEQAVQAAPATTRPAPSTRSVD